MNQGVHPNPAQVPTLTEVIDLLTLAPVGERGMHHSPRPAAPAPGTPGAAPIVTSGLSAAQAQSHWTPMSTVVLSGMDNAPVPPMVSLADVPVLESVVFEPSAPMAPAPSAERAESVVLPEAAAVLPSPPESEPANPAALPEITEAQLAQRVLTDVQKQIDGMLDFRLREALAPIMARHSDALVRDLREELKRTMHDVVTRSVAQEMAKLRQR
jgi:hypothetical protein